MTRCASFDRFSTLNAISNGRAEVIVGRGSFTESFPLFGYDLSLYEQLFEEKLNLFAELLKGAPVTWRGRLRGGLSNQKVYPPSEREGSRPWVAVGGSPSPSCARRTTACRSCWRSLAAVRSVSRRGRSYIRSVCNDSVKPMQPIGVHSPGHVSDTDNPGERRALPHHLAMMNRIGAERGWPPSGAREFEHAAGPDGASIVGSPETVAKKSCRR
jgi:alkanesulfonate monooxygenase SsuD/methylene tetrahydromethanopterin reductase-like flavin-dependent oxidoreductase (luciferase family)